MSHPTPLTPSGTGLGFRRELMSEFLQLLHDEQEPLSALDFFEVSPENWINSSGLLGGNYHRQLRSFTERFPFVCHGLSLSIGSTAELDTQLLNNIKSFMKAHDMSLYTEHLSWCSDENGHLYDLLPIPCTQEAVKWVASRIQQAQDIMGQRIGFENASYYFVPENSEMSDTEFITAVVREADCLLHLDINNIYVNSQNFSFDPKAYLRELPLDRVCYMHVAGHYTAEDGFIIDTHGNSVINPVWDLLQESYQLINEQTGKHPQSIPTCLERDFNFPALTDLVQEAQNIRYYQNLSEVAHVKSN